jgi:imidazole glycerol-phosphate synthase subunit HisF
MPMGYGGGVATLEDAHELFSIGFEKVVVNSGAVASPTFVGDAAARFGSQSVVVSLDVRRSWRGRYEVVTHAGTRPTGLDPVALAQRMQQAGAGELLLNAIDRDGTMDGCDLELIRRVAAAVSIPLTVCGGVGQMHHIVEAVRSGGASAVAAGSFFVFHGKHRAVLISYPPRAALEEALG